jgi:hypothetical protein
MTELPHVDSFDPEEKDGLASPSTSECSATTNALTPPRAQYGATQGKAQKGNWPRNRGFATSGKPLQRMNSHS